MRPSRSHLAVLAAVVVLAACSDSTAPVSTPDAETPDLGPTLTLGGSSAILSSGLGGVSGAVSGNPFAIAVARGGTGTPAPTCTPMPSGVTSCSVTFDGLAFTYSFGWRDSLGIRNESEVRGTLAAASGQPARRIFRRATSWTQFLLDDPATITSTTHRSEESGTVTLLGGNNAVMTDSGRTDVRMFLRLGTTPADRIPRMIGTTRRVVWTAVPGTAPTFWRETTTYDSSTVIRSVIETAAGTKRCAIDLAAATFSRVCS